MNDNNYSVGDAVRVTPKDFDFSNEFDGEIVEIHQTYVTVREGDDNYFDVYFDQIEPA